MSRPVNRITPALSPQHMKTYAIVVPRATHTRPATCAEIECEPWKHGWACTVTENSPEESLLLQAAAGTVDGHMRRYYRPYKDEDGFLRYVFGPGQPCFAASSHRVPLEREPVHLVKSGDWRATTGEPFVHTRGEHWVEDFGEHQQRIHDQRERYGAE
jgi:hypothetical protein